MKVLLTAGATREPIDAVRFISNVSTGATGAALAETLAAAGHEITYLHGVGAVRPAADGVTCGVFTTAEHLGTRLRAALAADTFDVIIQAAAVADYRPATAHPGKMGSHEPGLDLRLVPTPKLLPQLKAWSPRPIRVLGFKLTHGADAAARARAVARVFAPGGVDAVVHNDLAELNVAGGARSFRIYRTGDADAVPLLCPGIAALGAWASAWIHEPAWVER